MVLRLSRFQQARDVFCELRRTGAPYNAIDPAAMLRESSSGEHVIRDLKAIEMTDISQVFLQKSRNLLVVDYLPKIERCLADLSDEQVWARPNEASNSIGNLLLHLRGNVTQWILGGVGGREYVRHRQHEFDERTPLPARELLERLRDVVHEADEIIRGLDAAALLSAREIQGYDGTVLEAIYHVVEHFSMHTGQIILLAKARTGADLRLWEPPSGAEGI
jgi:uncharacterized damage-inducible protein DinB